MLVCSVTPLCPTLCDSIDCSLPGSSVPGIFQARILEWVAVSYSGGSSWPRDWTLISWSPTLADILFINCTTWEILICLHTHICYIIYVHTCIHTGEGNGNPLQCSCLENPRDGGAWWAAVCGAAQSRTRLTRLSSGSIHTCMHLYIPAEAAYSTSAPSALPLTQTSGFADLLRCSVWLLPSCSCSFLCT